MNQAQLSGAGKTIKYEGTADVVSENVAITEIKERLIRVQKGACKLSAEYPVERYADVEESAGSVRNSRRDAAKIKATCCSGGDGSRFE